MARSGRDGLYRLRRTPITLNRGPVRHLRDRARERLSPEDIEQVEIVERNADRLRRLVGQLLGLARLDAGTYRLSARPVDVTREAVEIAVEDTGVGIPEPSRTPSSTALSKPLTRQPASRRGRASASPSPPTSWICTAAPSLSRAPRARGRRSPPPFPAARPISPTISSPMNQRRSRTPPMPSLQRPPLNALYPTINPQLPSPKSRPQPIRPRRPTTNPKSTVQNRIGRRRQRRPAPVRAVGPDPGVCGGGGGQRTRGAARGPRAPYGAGLQRGRSGRAAGHEPVHPLPDAQGRLRHDALRPRHRGAHGRGQTTAGLGRTGHAGGLRRGLRNARGLQQRVR